MKTHSWAIASQPLQRHRAVVSCECGNRLQLRGKRTAKIGDRAVQVECKCGKKHFVPGAGDE